MKIKTPVALIVLDGWGVSKKRKGNAIALGNTKNFEKLWKDYPCTTLSSSGTAVGLPKGQTGSSEVGHMHIAAGRIILQQLEIINRMIKNRDFFRNKVLLQALETAKRKNKSIHLMGLVSDGGVHSHINHLYALLEMCKKNKVEKVYVHAFLDGRDVPPKSAKKYLKALERKMKNLKTGRLSTIIGRYYAMDRDNRWKREHKAYDLIVNRKGMACKDLYKTMDKEYSNGITDEFMKPIIIKRTDGFVKEGDSIIFFNFRSDRARELTRAFTQGSFRSFKRKRLIDINFVCLSQYDKKIRTPVAFSHEKIRNSLGEIFARRKIRQLRVAETEKYAHVTFFFNEGRESPFKNEERILVPSPKISTYDKKPEMSAFEITKKATKRINKRKYGFVLINYANADMVGHTGKLKAAINAVETVDKCLGKIVPFLRKKGFIVIITADHGNAEEIIDAKGRTVTSHRPSKVPFILVSDKHSGLKAGGLANIAPTVLELMNIEKPKEMSKGLIC